MLASHVAAILASHVAISTITSRGGHNKQGAVASPPRRPLLMWFPSRQLLDTPAATNSMPAGGQCTVCKEAHSLEKCEQFKRLSPEQRVVKV
jgi:hypothetical protein